MDRASYAACRGRRNAASERFGLWISFYPFDQEAYLKIVAHWLQSFGCARDEIVRAERDALNWALERGSRSGRVAWQFARDWAGRQLVAAERPKRARSKGVRSVSSVASQQRSGSGS